MAYMEEQMDNAELTIDQFAEQLMLSRTIFYRKFKINHRTDACGLYTGNT